VTQRLRAEDLAFWVTDSASTPMHNATLEIFEPRGAFDHDRLLALVTDRIAFVPRYRQVIRQVPGRLANPVWVDDEEFDLTYHVRRSALPRPGSIAQLRDLTARIMSRRLDHQRPLWEMYLVEGLAGGRFAVLSKSHQILVDGVATIDIGQVILDVEPTPKPTPQVAWHARPAPGPSSLVAAAVRDSLFDPRVALRTFGENAGSLVRTAAAVRGRVLDAAGALAGRPPVAVTPITTRLSEQRRFMTVATSLEDYRKVRRFHGGTVNDVILTTVTGAMRAWLMTRAETVPLAACPGAGQRDRRRARADVAGQPGRGPPGQPAHRGGQPGGAAAPGVL
jgi:diacylglycerol O-acyltransferase / wax synthase